MKYKFEIQSLIKVEIDAVSKDEAERIVQMKLQNGDYADRFANEAVI